MARTSTSSILPAFTKLFLLFLLASAAGALPTFDTSQLEKEEFARGPQPAGLLNKAD
ncbi:hypothetical protein PM082_007711 [Marasmius tenuissimus]|nr:hypothetical protein PM082_007711 [Marasmius tenuissimus]